MLNVIRFPVIVLTASALTFAVGFYFGTSERANGVAAAVDEAPVRALEATANPVLVDGPERVDSFDAGALQQLRAEYAQLEEDLKENTKKLSLFMRMNEKRLRPAFRLDAYSLELNAQTWEILKLDASDEVKIRTALGEVYEAVQRYERESAQVHPLEGDTGVGVIIPENEALRAQLFADVADRVESIGDPIVSELLMPEIENGLSFLGQKQSLEIYVVVDPRMGEALEIKRFYGDSTRPHQTHTSRLDGIREDHEILKRFGHFFELAERN